MNMFEGENAVPEREQRAADDPECARVRKVLPVFVAGLPAAAEVATLRAHLAVCEDCNQDYRERLIDAARAGRERRLSRATRGRPTVPVLRSRGRGVRSLVVGGFFMFVLMRILPLGAEAKVFALEGGYHIGEQLHDVSDLPQSVRGGDWIATGAQAAARLERDSGASVQLAASSRVCIEDADVLRLFLEIGTITVEGPCEITSCFGAVEIGEGTARLAIDAESLQVVALAGQTIAATSSGERKLSAGESARLLSAGL